MPSPALARSLTDARLHVVTGKGGALWRKKWFAGSDAANGGKEVVNGVAEGRDAARAIHAMFTGGSK